MKTYKHLWEKFISEENFSLASKKAIKNKKKQKQVKKYLENEKENLEAIRQMVINGEFHTSKYKTKKVFEPKERDVYMLPFMPDRIVHHAVINILKPIFLNKFIDNSYSCIEDRGQIKASIKCSEFSRKYDYCLQCDIHKFYPSINQKILSEMLHKIIKDDKFMNIVDDIIFSFPGETNIPIGNFPSQWFGNYYLTTLDNYVYHDLKCHAYIRFCDDFLLFSNDKKFLQKCKKEIEIFLRNELQLCYSKAEVFRITQGVDFCGYRHFTKYVLIRKSTSKRIKKRFAKILMFIKDGTLLDLDKKLGQVSSANGVMKHACSYNFRTSISYKNINNKIRQLIKERNKLYV